MKRERKSSGARGTSVGTVVLVIFITLKLLGVQPVAGWSWVWVLSPMWICLGLALAIFLVWGLVLACLWESFAGWRRQRAALRREMAGD